MSDAAARPALLVCVSHGFHVRNILYSPLYPALLKRFRVVLVLPAGVEVPPHDVGLLHGAEAVVVPIVAHRFEQAFVFLRKNVFAGRERTQSYNLISEIERARHPLLYAVAGRLNAVFGRFPALARLWQRVEGSMIRGGEFDALIERTQPAGVLSANYGTEAFEVRLLRAAHRRRVPSLAVVPSWDNLSSKGVIGENPKHLAVWNQIMADEAVSLYGFDRAAIHVCGGLQFDRYAQRPQAAERDAVVVRLGIDPQRPYVVVGTITPRYFAANIDIVDLIDEAVEAGRLPAQLQIVVRLHPQVVDDPHFGDDLGPYRARAAASPRIKLSIPRVLRWGRITPPSPDDGTELAVLLSGAVACVMPASTLAIDACALGAPVIGIGFDGRQTKPYAQSVRRMFDFTHYRRLVMQDGLRIADSSDALIIEIQAYLADRSRDRAGRATIVSTHLGMLDGAAWCRVAGALDKLAAGGSASASTRLFESRHTVPPRAVEPSAGVRR